METSVTSNSQRKFWLDNLRWITIILVVIFHIFYFYNNIGGDQAPMFQRLEPNPAVEGGKATVTFAGIFQYSVYQWFMLLLFIVSGMCAKYTLRRKSVKEFLHGRVQKLLVPSTLGVLCVHWIAGWLETYMFLPADVEIPGFVKFFIAVASGIGGLWFCHVLIVASLILALIKTIDKNAKFEALCEKSNIFVAAGLYILMFGAAQILNIPMIATYRMAYFPLAFLLGYYVFTSEKLLAQLKKYGWICLITGIVAGVFYEIKFYGTYYAEYKVLNDWLSILHAWFTAIGILGVAQLLDFENPFTRYMNKAGWGIYINHITILIVFNYLIRGFAVALPVWVIYALELIVALAASIGLWEVLRRIPVLRYVLYGIRNPKAKKEKIDV